MAQSARHGRVTTILNRKGGVGKTFSTWLLVGACLDRGKRLCVIDLDEQRNITRSLLDDPQVTRGAEVLFDPSAEPDVFELVRPTRFEGVDIIPSTLEIQNFDETARFKWEKDELQFSLVDPILRLRERYDHVVFDCPPNLSLLAFSALCASDFVLVPLEAADWGAQGVMDVSSAITWTRQRWNDRLKLLGYLVNKYKKARKVQRAYLTELRNTFGENAFETVIPDLSLFEQSVVEKLPITRYAPASTEANICRAFFREFEARAERLGRVGLASR